MIYKVGDTVDLRRWDETVPPRDRLGVCKVVRVARGQRSQSGTLLTVGTSTGVVKKGLDSDWADPVSE